MGLRPQVVMIVERYPQLSETYIATEAAGLAGAGLLAGLVALRMAKDPLLEHLPFQALEDEESMTRVSADVGATTLHTHYLHMAPLVSRVARRSQLPFTVRTHSYDVLKAPASVLRRTCALLNNSNCTAVLGFPFVCEILRAHGMRAGLTHDAWPVVDYHRFLDRSPNAEGVLNLGAALDKKNMKAYLEFAASKPATRFSLYPVGYQTPELIAHNVGLGSPVDIRRPVQPADMPPVYKDHSWLVYSASLELNTVGWPMAVAEAQASGLGVCLQSRRADATTYLGGAGLVFTRFAEIADIVSGPVPRDMRERGFLAAARSDIAEHVRQLTAIWSGHAG